MLGLRRVWVRCELYEGYSLSERPEERGAAGVSQYRGGEWVVAGGLTCRVLDASGRAALGGGGGEADWVRAGTGFVRFF